MYFVNMDKNWRQIFWYLQIVGNKIGTW